MPSTTPNYALALYNTTTDQTQTFIDFRSALAGTSASSNMNKIDTALKDIQDQVTELASSPSIIPVSGAYVSANYYEATVAEILAYETNMVIILKLDTSSSGTVTLNINSLGTKTLMKYNSVGVIVNLDGKDLSLNREYLFRYDGIRWIWIAGTSADQVDIDGTAGNFIRISSGNNLEDSTYSPSSFALAAKGVTNGDSHDHIGGDGSAIAEGALSLSDVTTGDVSTTKHGFTPKAPADSSKILSGLDGTWKTFNGWTPSDETWSYDSVSGQIGIIKTNADKRTKYSAGMKKRFSQSQALTSYWPLDANSNDSLGLHNGTDTNITYTTGKFSNGASFNGTTSKIVISDSTLLKPTGKFTIGLWFKTGATGVLQGLFQSYSANTSVAGVSLRINSADKVALYIGKNTGSTAGVDFTFISGNTVVSDNLWHYVVATYNGNNYMQLYVDGKLEAGGFAYNPVYATTNYVRMGCFNTAGTDGTFLNGMIDDMFLINGYALDEETIKNKYDLDTAQGSGNITVTKNFIINAVTYSGGYTYLYLHGGIDFSLANSTISNVFYSQYKSPYGFNLNPDKWSIIVYNFLTNTKTSPTATTWYNAMDSGNLPTISIPIGIWDSYYELFAYATSGSSTTSVNVFATLSNASGTESNPLWTGVAGVGGASGTIVVNAQFSKRNIVVANVATTLYLNIKTNVASAANINVSGASTPIKLIATNAYL